MNFSLINTDEMRSFPTAHLVHRAMKQVEWRNLCSQWMRALRVWLVDVDTDLD